MINEVINGLPLHFQKENNIRFYNCLKPIIEYLNFLTENLKAQTSLLDCTGIFLDFMGERYNEKRKGRNDEGYRQALIVKRMALERLPNTEFLLSLTRKLTEKEVIKLETRTEGEPASQLFKVSMLDDLKAINKMPDLNKVCEVGAKIYWELEIIKENLNICNRSTLELAREIEIKANFELDQTLKIESFLDRRMGIGFTKIIEIGGDRSELL